MAMSAEIVKICSPSPIIGTSLYKWKILEWDAQRFNPLHHRRDARCLKNPFYSSVLKS